jgi:hypothetical protein
MSQENVIRVMEEESLVLVKHHIRDLCYRTMLGHEVIPPLLQAAFAINKKAIVLRALREVTEELSDE